MRKLWVAFAAGIAALAGSVLPSGAGQHFGIIGGDGGTFITGNAFGPAGPASDGELSASGFFVRGAIADVTDQGTSRASLVACVTVKTAQGSDYGCTRGDGIPRLSDPALSSAALILMIPSSVHRGGFIDVHLNWTAAGQLEPDVSTTLPAEHLTAEVAAGLARRSTVSGSIRSSTVGGGEVTMADGFLTRGTSVRACSADNGTAPC